MPWINEGGGGGSWKPTGGGPWGQKPSSSPPDLEELLGRWQARIRQWLPGGGGGFGGGRGILALGLIGVAFWLLSGFYAVGPE